MVNAPFKLVKRRLGEREQLLLDNRLRRPMTVAVSQYPRDVNDPNDIRGRYSLSRRRFSNRDGSSAGVPLPSLRESKLPSFLEYDQKVLLFNA